MFFLQVGHFFCVFTAALMHGSQKTCLHMQSPHQTPAGLPAARLHLLPPTCIVSAQWEPNSAGEACTHTACNAIALMASSMWQAIRSAVGSVMLASTYNTGDHRHSGRSSPTGPARHRLHGVEADGTLRLWRACWWLQRRSLLYEGWQAPFLLLLLGLQHFFKCILWRVRG